MKSLKLVTFALLLANAASYVHADSRFYHSTLLGQKYPKVSKIDAAFKCIRLGFGEGVKNSILLEMAKQGNPKAQYALEIAESLCSELEVNTAEELVDWLLELSEEAEDLAVLVHAKYTLGKMYYAGIGVDRDLIAAKDYLAPLADIEYLDSKLLLSCVLIVKKNYVLGPRICLI